MKHNWDIEELIEHFTLLAQILVAELAGHKRLETTRHYILPSAEDRDTAMEGLRMGNLAKSSPLRSLS